MANGLLGDRFLDGENHLSEGEDLVGVKIRFISTSLSQKKQSEE